MWRIYITCCCKKNLEFEQMGADEVSITEHLSFCSQLGDQLIADLGQFLNFLILSGNKKRETQMTHIYN